MGAPVGALIPAGAPAFSSIISGASVVCWVCVAGLKVLQPDNSKRMITARHGFFMHQISFGNSHHERTSAEASPLSFFKRGAGGELAHLSHLFNTTIENSMFLPILFQYRVGVCLHRVN